MKDQQFKNTLSVLVVEDDAIASKVIQMILIAKGCKVTCATSGEEALELINNSFSFIIMDIGLPGLDGIETARQISKLPNVSQIPIIALTAHEDGPSKIQQAKAAGMKGYFLKPFTPKLCDFLLKELQDLKAREKDFWLTVPF